MAPTPLDKVPAGSNSPQNCLISLDMDLDLCVICRDENGTNGYCLAVSSVDIALSCHFVALHPPPILPTHRNTSGISYISKNYLNGGLFS